MDGLLMLIAIAGILSFFGGFAALCAGRLVGGPMMLWGGCAMIGSILLSGLL